MKKYIFFVLCFGYFTFASAQEMPSMILDAMDGNTINTAKLSADKPIVFAFWATWCSNCVHELDAIQENIDDWAAETDFDFYAVSIDDSRTQRKVKPFVNGKGWAFPVLYDTNSQLKKAVGASSVPFTIIVKNGKIVYSHSGYKPGGEDRLFGKIQKYAN